MTYADQDGLTRSAQLLVHVGRRPPIDVRFAEFHRRNPHIFDLLLELALQAVKVQPSRKLSIAMLYEAARYSRLISTGDAFKLNNDFRSRYTRLLEEREPRLRGRFETRRIRS